jgi:hypothetical protein
MTKDEALDLALEFFETMQRYKGTRSNIFIRFEPTATGDYVDLREFDGRAKPIITAIKQARSAPVQEPVAWPIDEDVAKRIAEKQFVSYEVVQLIARAILATPPAAQRQWVGLTDERRKAIYDECQGLDVMKAISQTEAKLKEKNNG